MKKYSEDFEEDLLPRAFHVVGESNPEDGAPTNGEEYLKCVRWVTRRTPGTVTSSDATDPPRTHDQKKSPMIEPQTKVITPESVKPKREWQESFVADFSELRRNLNVQAKQLKEKEKLGSMKPPLIRDEKKWKELCYGPSNRSKAKNSSGAAASSATTAAPSASSSEEGVTPAVASPVANESATKSTSALTAVGPLLSLIVPLDELSVNALLSRHINWATKRTLTRENTAWLFALLCRVEKPLDADLAADMRQLLRRCVEVRASFADPAMDRSLLPAINIIITIVELYFGQQDPDD